MEDVLAVYERPYNPARPLVCFDESRKELHAELAGREPIPMDCGMPKRVDYSYKREGSANLFMVSEPLRGWRRVAVTDQHTKLDVADQLKQIVDEDYPQAEKVVLISDNLTSHSMAALYERFVPAEARRIAERIEWHFTPEHGSWLNMAEIEFAALQRQCLNRRIADKQVLQREVHAWEQARNDAEAKIKWQFTADDARTKLRRLYPTLESDPNI
jgi:hypothetical protein